MNEFANTPVALINYNGQNITMELKQVTRVIFTPPHHKK